uniref:Uncharacterized protein n=1 Tax=Glossina palpalis gambiensis TaxID=67801 RepID=A0A1B0BR49_9MUSC
MNMCGLKTSGGFGCILAHCVGLELALVQYYKDGVLLIGYEVFCLMMLKLGATEKGTASPAASERLSSSPDRVLTRSPVRFCVVLIQMFKTDVGKQYK